jgi:hypothetical protein
MASAVASSTASNKTRRRRRRRGGGKRRRSFGQLVRDQVHLWVDLFQRHNLLTFATAIAMQSFVAFVSLTLLVVGVLGMIGRENVWNRHIGPAIASRVLADVYSGANATVQKSSRARAPG